MPDSNSYTAITHRDVKLRLDIINTERRARGQRVISYADIGQGIGQAKTTISGVLNGHYSADTAADICRRINRFLADQSEESADAEDCHSGWARGSFIRESYKWHYFVKGRSACDRYQIPDLAPLKSRDLADPRNCQACCRILRVLLRITSVPSLVIDTAN